MKRWIIVGVIATIFLCSAGCAEQNSEPVDTISVIEPIEEQSGSMFSEQDEEQAAPVFSDQDEEESDPMCDDQDWEESDPMCGDQDWEESDPMCDDQHDDQHWEWWKEFDPIYGDQGEMTYGPRFVNKAAKFAFNTDTWVVGQIGDTPYYIMQEEESGLYGIFCEDTFDFSVAPIYKELTLVDDPDYIPAERQDGSWVFINCIGEEFE